MFSTRCPHCLCERLVKELCSLFFITSGFHASALTGRCAPVLPADQLDQVCNTKKEWGGGGRKFTNLLFVESSGPFFSTVMVFSSKQLLLSGFGPGPPSSHSPDRCVASAVSRGTLGGCVRSLSARWRFFISRWNQVLAQEISCLSWFCRFPDSAASVSPRDSLPRLWCHASHTLVKPSNYWTLFLNFFIACACLTWVFTQTQQLCCQMYGWQPVVWKKAALHSLVLPFSRFIGQKNRSRSDTFFLSSSW